MAITVKFFASLSEQLGMDEVQLDTRTPLSVRAAWEQATGNAPLPPKTICAVNMEYADMDDSVQDCDEVAFFPPVTGGSGNGWQR